MKEELVKKIVTMAKRGTEHERENAKRILKKFCERNNVDYDKLMNEEENLEEFLFAYKSKATLDVAAQAYFKFFGGKTMSHNREYIFIKSTREKYVDYCNAVILYGRAYRKERATLLERRRKEDKAFSSAFIHRHQIYPETSEDDKRNIDDLTQEQLEELRMAWKMADNMNEEVLLHKQLT